MNRIRSGRYFKTAKFFSLSPSLQDLIDKMLKVREEDRLSTDQVLDHPWMKVGLPQQVEKHASEEAMEVEEESVEDSISLSRTSDHYIHSFILSFIWLFDNGHV